VVEDAQRALLLMDILLMSISRVSAPEQCHSVVSVLQRTGAICNVGENCSLRWMLSGKMNEKMNKGL
jgi:hypothetical protein